MPHDILFQPVRYGTLLVYYVGYTSYKIKYNQKENKGFPLLILNYDALQFEP